MTSPAPKYLLDTNVMSELIRHPQGPLARRVSALPAESCVTSVVVACELRYGAAKRGSAELTSWVEGLLESIEALPFEAEASRRYAEIRIALEKAGTPIGRHDLLIAAHAQIEGLVLVTANVSEFARVPGLRVENWLV